MHWRANLLMLRSPRAIVGFVALSMWPVGVLIAALWLLGFWGDRNPFVRPSVLSVVGGLASFLGFLLLQHIAFSQALSRTYAPFVRMAMRLRGTPVCLHCGHLLLGSVGERCPECGTSG
jgi:hypothetical protein